MIASTNDCEFIFVTLVRYEFSMRHDFPILLVGIILKMG